jgi:hypothetical protein
MVYLYEYRSPRYLSPFHQYEGQEEVQHGIPVGVQQAPDICLRSTSMRGRRRYSRHTGYTRTARPAKSAIMLLSTVGAYYY